MSSSGNIVNSQGPAAKMKVPALTVSPDESVTLCKLPFESGAIDAFASTNRPPFFWNVVTPEQYERLGVHGCGGRVDADTANHIAAVIECRLMSTEMKPGERMLADPTVTSSNRIPTMFMPNGNVESVETNDIHSASYEWLVAFRDFVGGLEASRSTSQEELAFRGGLDRAPIGDI